MRICDWSSDVCASDLDPAASAHEDHALAEAVERRGGGAGLGRQGLQALGRAQRPAQVRLELFEAPDLFGAVGAGSSRAQQRKVEDDAVAGQRRHAHGVGEVLRLQPFMVVARSEEHTSELQSLMRISYAVFCLKKTKT